jgi:hypothetical protein
MMGMTMIVGIAMEMAIFYVSEYSELAHALPARQALLEASRNRLRPIAMTTLAAILTQMPLALGLGDAAASRGRDHRRPRPAIPIGAFGDAGADRACRRVGTARAPAA